MLNTCRLNRHALNACCWRDTGDALSVSASLALAGECYPTFFARLDSAARLVGSAQTQSYRVYWQQAEGSLTLSGECTLFARIIELAAPLDGAFTLAGEVSPFFRASLAGDLKLAAECGIAFWQSLPPTARAYVLWFDRQAIVPEGDRTVFVRDVE